jgi:hypothetical protein
MTTPAPHPRSLRIAQSLVAAAAAFGGQVLAAGSPRAPILPHAGSTPASPSPAAPEDVADDALCAAARLAAGLARLATLATTPADRHHYERVADRVRGAAPATPPPRPMTATVDPARHSIPR